MKRSTMAAGTNTSASESGVCPYASPASSASDEGAQRRHRRGASSSGFGRAACALALFSSLAATAHGFLAPQRPPAGGAAVAGALAAGRRIIAEGGAWEGSSSQRRRRLATAMSAVANSHTDTHTPTHHTTPTSPLPEQPAINQYPVFPRAAVNIVVVRSRPLNMGREYLFVQRSKEPGTNQWSLPGGSVELGEEMLVAAAREVVEETTLDHEVLQFYPRCFMTTDAIYNDDMGAVKYHFVISQMVCWAAPEAEPVAGDDAKDIRWMTLPQLRGLNDKGSVFRGVVEVIETVERLVDVGCITKADLVRVPVEVDPSLAPGPNAKRAQPSSALDIDGDDDGHEPPPNHLIPKRRS